jgi:hypothetical protein
MQTPEIIDDIQDGELTEESLDFQPNQEPESQEYHTEIDSTQTLEISDEFSVLEEDENPQELESGELQEFETPDNLGEPDIEEVLDESPEANLNEDFVEIDDLDNDEETIVVDLDDEEAEELDSESLDKQIVEDVDKVFTTIKEDSISDSDLDFIDELNSDSDEDSLETSDSQFEELPQELTEESDDGFIEPIQEFAGNNSPKDNDKGEILETRNTSTPIVPVYDAEIPQEDIVMSDPIEQGDRVVHAKYGSGIVEKMIKYGTKTLYSINFDNIGRRLLDPTLTEIKKG